MLYRNSSEFCGDEYRYFRVYNDSHYNLFGVGDGEFRLLRALVYYSDKVDLYCRVYDRGVRVLVIDHAFARKPNVSGDGFVRLYRKHLRSLFSKRLIIDSREFSSGKRSVLVNPRVLFGGDFKDRGRAILMWDRCLKSEIRDKARVS